MYTAASVCAQEVATVERNGQPCALFFAYDVDGTVAPEELPEAERFYPDNVWPARATLGFFGQRGIASGANTTRTFSEARLCYNALDRPEPLGPFICETGSLVVGPDGREHRRSNLTLRTLEEFVRQKIIQLTNDPVVSSVTSSREDLRAAAGHHSDLATIASMQRKSSTYIAAPTSHIRELVAAHAESAGILALDLESDRPITLHDPAHDKGTALHYIDRHAQVFFPRQEVAGIVPIAIGNSLRGDGPAFAAAKDLGGFAVLVGSADSDIDGLPAHVLAVAQPHGYGMQAAIAPVGKWLQDTYGFKL